MLSILFITCLVQLFWMTQIMDILSFINLLIKFFISVRSLICFQVFFFGPILSIHKFIFCRLKLLLFTQFWITLNLFFYLVILTLTSWKFLIWYLIRLIFYFLMFFKEFNDFLFLFRLLLCFFSSARNTWNWFLKLTFTKISQVFFRFVCSLKPRMSNWKLFKALAIFWIVIWYFLIKNLNIFL